MITKHILSFCRKHKTSLFFAFFVLGSFFLLGESAFANASPEPAISAEDSQKVVKILNSIITGAAALMAMITSFITMFLYPGWVNGTLFGLQDYLKLMWILVSNVVYFIFAFILIAIAFMNIINKGEGIWELKQALPKFVIGVLIVPFSWFFVQFVLSISAILTVGVLTLPYDAFQSEPLFQEALENEKIGGQKVCKDIIITLTGEAPDNAKKFTGPNGEDIGESLYCRDEGEVTVKQIFEGTDSGAGLNDSIFGVISVYTYGILQIHNLDTINVNQVGDIKKIADLVFKIFFDILFVIAYMLLMVALFLALFVRGVRLWIFMMLSPAFGLLYFFGKEKEGVGGEKAKFSITEFIGLAMVPVYVSAALSFGLVFILVASEGIKNEAMEGGDDKITVGGFSLELMGAHGGDEEGGSPIAKLIVEIFGIVILWIAVMAALKGSKTTEQITEPIRAFGNSVGDIAMKAPTYTPIIPAPGGLQSAASLKTIGGQFQSMVTSSQTDQAQKFMDGANLGGGITKLNTEAEKAARNIKRLGDSGDSRGAISELRKLLRQHVSDPSKIRSSKQTQEAIINAARAVGMTTIDGVQLENVKFNSDRDVRNAIAEIDMASAKATGSDATSLFEGHFGKDGMTDEQFKNWLQTGKTGASTETPPPAGTTNNAITIEIGGQNGTLATNTSEFKFDGTGSATKVNENAAFREMKDFFTERSVTRANADTKLRTYFPSEDQRNALLDAMGLKDE